MDIIKSRRLLIASLIVLVLVWGWVFAHENSLYQKIFTISLILLLMVEGGRDWLRITKDIKQGRVLEDEMSLRMDFEAGFFSYLGTLAVFLVLLFMVHNESVDMGNAIRSAVFLVIGIYIICRVYIRRYYDKNGF